MFLLNVVFHDVKRQKEMLQYEKICYSKNIFLHFIFNEFHYLFFTEKSAFMALGGVFLIVAAVVYAFEINKSKK